MTAEELREKDTNELQKMVHELNKKLSDLRFNFAANKLKNVKEISNIKKEIARILTVVNEKFKLQISK